MLREKILEYFNMLKKDRKDWYTYFTINYRITNLKFLNLYLNIEDNLKEEMKNLTRPIVDSAHQEWKKVRVQLKSDLNYLLDYIKFYIDYYEGDNKILFFGGIGKTDFYYIEIPGFYYIGIDVVGYYKKYNNFNLHLPIMFNVLKTQFSSYDVDELKFISLKIIEHSNRKINIFNTEYLPKKNYDKNYIKNKYGLKREI